ncbi:MBL fold metallo-hydrolase [Bradyrhizobium sp. CNPSo 4010]|uniref:MBL fold metallo-hydrolase n=1 Tax=Bradyrhizobium agreste TaxID=2751811 RepID=A0ABS0PTD6_9BRAD|nr:MBL fold metallo-hydrolase [Bradyrhizobium agreste]MBH5400468.1 MBL fold metallo-hydrolase [Bradyrhizobium agreste]
MALWTCATCGAQFPDSVNPPTACPICEDERQFVGWSGQAFLTREELARKHRLVGRDDLGLTGIGMEPSFAIGQRALLVPDGDGCVMWDCIPLATDEAIQHVAALGGLLRTGGHFAGATVLHYARGADGKGALLTGDIAQVTMDRRFVSFMYSYPNYMPLNAAAVRRIASVVEPLAFDRVYGAWWGRNIASGAKAAFAASVARYLAAIA